MPFECVTHASWLGQIPESAEETSSQEHVEILASVYQILRSVTSWLEFDPVTYPDHKLSPKRSIMALFIDGDFPENLIQVREARYSLAVYRFGLMQVRRHLSSMQNQTLAVIVWRSVFLSQELVYVR